MDDEERALTAARHLAEHGVPIGRARPAGGRTWDQTGGTGGSGYWMPKSWQNSTEPDPDVVDQWQPGEALYAVMGHTVDGIDVDPQHGGRDSIRDMPVPKVHGVASTPSGGWHGYVKSLGTGSRDNVAPGVDFKGGREDGTGRGFLWLPPTVKQSKTTGQPSDYTWQRTPDLDGLDGDQTGRDFAQVVRDKLAPPTNLTHPTTEAVQGAAPDRILAGLAEKVAGAVEGNRNGALFWAANRALEHAAEGRLSWDEAAAALVEAAERAGLTTRETHATLDSAYRTTNTPTTRGHTTTTTRGTTMSETATEDPEQTYADRLAEQEANLPEESIPGQRSAAYHLRAEAEAFQAMADEAAADAEHPLLVDEYDAAAQQLREDADQVEAAADERAWDAASLQDGVQDALNEASRAEQMGNEPLAQWWREEAADLAAESQATTTGQERAMPTEDTEEPAG